MARPSVTSGRRRLPKIAFPRSAFGSFSQRSHLPPRSPFLSLRLPPPDHQQGRAPLPPPPPPDPRSTPSPIRRPRRSPTPRSRIMTHSPPSPSPEESDITIMTRNRRRRRRRRTTECDGVVFVRQCSVDRWILCIRTSKPAEGDFLWKEGYTIQEVLIMMGK